MTGQIPDSFLYKDEVYSLSGISKGDLFSPTDYGFSPRIASTACWRGYVLYFTIRNESLILVDMAINASEELEINGVKPEKKNNTFKLHYHDLNFKIDFTGTLIIAKDFIDTMYVHMGFQRLIAYETVLELNFDHGKLISERDLSHQIKKQRDKNPLDKSTPKSMKDKDIREWIERSFSLEYNPDEDEEEE